MRIIIEGHQYDADKVNDILDGISRLKDVEGKISVNYVGYYYNPTLNDCVFILPKVLMEHGKLFGSYDPEEVIHVDECKMLNDEEYRFIYELAVWVYRAIVVFNELNKKNTIVRMQYVAQMGKGRLRQSNTFLDILLALQKFNKENQQFFFFILRNLHSGYNKINWTKTIAHEQAIVQQGMPVYMNVVNKKRQVNFDEELLVIYFSILNYMQERYGFPVQINMGFDLITGARFEQYMKGMGTARLRQIKYKYFSDKALYLWELCFAFFDQSKKINVETNDKEYLLVSDFNIVFESIIDELIGDKPDDDAALSELKEQKDGKRVDHIYRYKDLTNNTEEKSIYYIGDSKYYKRDREDGVLLGMESIYKQFTYARNVIQWNIDLFNDPKKEWQREGHLKLRDDITEGYNIIPNFFISAHQDNLSMEEELKEDPNNKDSRYGNRQFKNRLFDRDTFLLAHYDVNFLFIIALYGRNKTNEKRQWKEKIQGIFRDKIQSILSEKYTFYAMTAHADVVADDYLRENFQMVLGKVYTPYADTDYYSLALDNAPEFKEENKLVLDLLSQSFFVEKCKLGQDPSEVVQKVPRQAPVDVPTNFLPQFWLEMYRDKEILIGCYKDQQHLDWITGKNDKGTLIYNVRMGRKVLGGQTHDSVTRHKPVFAVLYDFEDETQYRVYHVNHQAEMTAERLVESKYPGTPSAKRYHCYVFDEKVTLGNLDLTALLNYYRVHHQYPVGAPLYITGEELLKYRK